MCNRCDKEVIEMGILESDMANLPYKLVNWFCMVKDCNRHTRLRDYGITPYYFWPVIIRRYPDGSWRGGWANCLHGYICGPHFQEYKADSRGFMKKYLRDEKEMISRIIPIEKSKLYKKSA